MHARRPPNRPRPECPVSTLRLGVYVDFVYLRVEDAQAVRFSTDRAVFLFISAVGESFEEFVVFGRVRAAAEDAEYVLPHTTEVVALRDYENLRRVGQVVRNAVGTAIQLWTGLSRVDVVWLFGPHPFAVLGALLALIRRKRIVLGVRQDSVGLYKTRLRGWRRIAGVGAMTILDGFFRGLGRTAGVTVQGHELAARYGSPRPNVLAMTVSAVREADIVDTVPDRDWSGPIDLLTVGRLEPEKNPLLLVEALAALNRTGSREFRLTWIGRGPLEASIVARARELGVDSLISFTGYVPFDGGLLELYRRSHVFVHVSLSEGMPMVVIEALASGTPLVATDVGGVRAAVGGDASAVLVPPGQLQPLVSGIERVVADAELRKSMTENGLEVARTMTLEAQAAKVVEFIAGT